MRYGSVCSGIEAATMAWHPLGWTPAFFSEIEAFPSAVLAHHYGSNMPGEPLAKNGIPNYGDFTQIGADAGPIDLLVGGTPCQSFSVAGKRLGLDDPRGNLALEYLSLARRLRARWIVWENVPGVVSSVTDEEDGEGGIQSGIEGREAGDEWIEESDFATFLSFVRECGYGFAYRVLDAQYVRVDGFGRAVPQRRRRVFVVGYLGDWRRAAAVLLEPQGMRGDSAPRREPGEGTAGTIDASAARSRGAGVNPGMITGDWPAQVSPTLDTYYGDKMGLEDQHIFNQRGGKFVPVAIQAGALRENPNSGPDGVGVQEGISYTLEARSEVQAVAFDTTQITSKANYSNPQIGDPCHPLASGAHPPAVAFAQNTRDEVRLFGGDGQVVGALAAEPGMKQQSYVAQDWAVRRLTPTECERLQGFPDNFTNVPWGKKDTSPDGPRYKSLGNSMAVNVMRWIGRRIEMVEKITKGEAA
ncbi:DNA cytosine methyltransferase [Rhizobium oryzihabitans]|uniref:Cytosine-specific methyltransferase n=2 Tax=Rhizobium oryzihabitans TaxID=2267833 RepID=A0A7L5BDF5_9HYPH|nr:DNA cytosine methyltransferase [Rhizobium oryzihabitans]QIB36862.1 DNA cytosine methyltransferase [Rhizobium oryzihabitans]QIB39335.1 DNA cytosine methyltransferase [Rhizobium oryzihabitans]